MAHIANRGLASLSEDEQFQFMDTLFEYSLELHTLMGPDLRSGSFSTYNELVDTVESKLKALSLSQSPADEQMLMKILGSHTRIGRPLPTSTSDGSKTTAEAKPISAMSRKEQNHLNVSASDKQAEMLSLLNHEYEQTFPGLRFVYVLLRGFSLSLAREYKIGTDYMQFVCQWTE